MNKKGSTLIELIVVVAIIAVISAVLIPQFMGYAHGMDLNKPMLPTEAVLEDYARAARQDSNITITILLYSATWAADSGGFEQIGKSMGEKDRVMEALVKLGVHGSQMNLLLANEGGLEFTCAVVPAKDGVYLILE
jgi:prepilin-type N-terminal cleavage/methylation domain-containing protein